ncbi:MAG: hypothetical protein AB1642_12950 [Pseudomonadota bacterium]
MNSDKLATFLRVLLLWLACCGAAAQAAEPAAFANVWRLRGEVSALEPKSGVRRPLRVGDAVRVGEHVSAAANAEAVLKTLDGGAVAVRPGAEFLAEGYAAQGRPTDRSILRIISGSLRIISGWIGRSNRAGHLVHTPTATIGIRGTDHEPYVMSAELAKKTANKEGTYDKVNRGRTALEVGEHSLEIEPGRVGFAQAPKMPAKKRALLTVLMPVLLDKIPDFYVPGEFDAELDLFSEIADILNERELARIAATGATPLAEPGAPPVAAPSPDAPAATTQAPASPAVPLPPGCDPDAVGRQWLADLDGAIKRLDAAAIVAGFAPDVVVRASVRKKDGGMTTVELGRDELVRSTIAAVQTLEDYRHRRISIDSTLVPSDPPGLCERVAISSVVVEQGKQAGKGFRFESLEEYVIELRAGKWLAVRAETTQR